MLKVDDIWSNLNQTFTKSNMWIVSKAFLRSPYLLFKGSEASKYKFFKKENMALLISWPKMLLISMIVSNHCLKACYTMAIVILLVVLIAFMEKRKHFMVNRRDGYGINLFITWTEVILALFCHNRTLLLKGIDLNM